MSCAAGLWTGLTSGATFSAGVIGGAMMHVFLRGPERVFMGFTTCSWCSHCLSAPAQPQDPVRQAAGLQMYCRLASLTA